MYRACPILFLALYLSTSAAGAATGKQVVGATETIDVAEAGLSYKARIDTGAETSSIHAVDIRVDGPGNAKGSPISFRTPTCL